MKRLVKSTIATIALISTMVYLSPVYAAANQETIYSKLDANGEKYKTIVTTKENGEVNQEETDKDLPIEAKITYKLDGKDIKPEDLAGKSGKVKIKIEYENKSAKKVKINGKEEIMYTPFVVAVGTVIKNANNKNIEVSDCGRIIENGERTIIVGMVFPGLDESLKLSGKLSDIEIPNSIEITMETENFEMSNVLAYATPRVLTESIDWSDFNDLFDSVNELQSSTDKLEDGANSLKDGIKTLKDGADSLNDGASKLNDGANSLDQGINTLKAGTSTLNSGAQSLSSGAAKVSSGASSVDKGATGLKEGLETLSESTKKLETGAEQISSAVSDISTNLSAINTQVKGLQTKLGQYASKKSELETLISIDKQYKAAAAGTAAEQVWDQNIKALEAEIELLDSASAIGDLANGLEQLSKGAEALDSKTSSLPTSVKALNKGVGDLKDGATELSKGTKTLSEGASSLNSGASSLAEGTKDVSSGVNALSQGSKTLGEGTKSLADGTKTLADGTNKLADGATELSNGIHKFNTEGIKKITNFINGDLKNLELRAKELEKLSEDYNKFNSDTTRDDINLISIIDSIKKDKNEDE